MVVEIDDTCWGLPINGVYLGYHHIENGKIVVKEIPVEFFQGDNFSSKKYLDKSVELTKVALFRDLKAKASEELRICRGYVLDKIYEWAISLDIPCKRVKIVGKLQNKMESVSRKCVNSLPEFSKEDSEPLYNALIRWLKEKPKERLKYAKTGWKALKKIF